MYVRTKLFGSVSLSVTKPKEFEILPVKVSVSKDSCIVLSCTVVDCYRPPSASKDAFESISDILHDLNNSEFILMGDLN